MIPRTLLPFLLLLAAPAAAQIRPEPLAQGFYGVSIQDVGKLVLVTAVYRETPAEKLAREGDLLLQIDGKPIRGTQQMIAEVGRRKPGAPATFLVLRGDRVFELKVKLGKRPAANAMQAVAQQPSPVEVELIAFCKGRPSSLRAWQAGLEAHRKQEFDRAARYVALCAALARHSELLDAQGAARAALERRIAQAELMLRLMRGRVAVPINTGLPDAASQALQQRIAQLVGQLGAAQYAAREQATRNLARLGEQARPALERAGQAAALEIRWRARQLLEVLDRQRAEGRQRLELALFRVAGGAGAGLRLERRFGPALVAGVGYRAALLDDKRPGRVVSFEAGGPQAVRQTSGAPLAAGARLVWLAPQPGEKTGQ